MKLVGYVKLEDEYSPWQKLPPYPVPNGFTYNDIILLMQSQNIKYYLVELKP